MGCAPSDLNCDVSNSNSIIAEAEDKIQKLKTDIANCTISISELQQLAQAQTDVNTKKKLLITVIAIRNSIEAAEKGIKNLEETISNQNNKSDEIKPANTLGGGRSIKKYTQNRKRRHQKRTRKYKK